MTKKIAYLMLSSLFLFCSQNDNRLPSKANSSVREEIKIPSKYGWKLFVYNEDKKLAGINEYPLYKPDKKNIQEFSTFLMSGIGRIAHPGEVDVYGNSNNLIETYDHNPYASELLEKVAKNYFSDVQDYFQTRDQCLRLDRTANELLDKLEEAKNIANIKEVDEYKSKIDESRNKYEKCMHEDLPSKLPKNLDKIVLSNIEDKINEVHEGDRFMCACGTNLDDNVERYKNAPSGWDSGCVDEMYCLLEIDNRTD